MCGGTGYWTHVQSGNHGLSPRVRGNLLPEPVPKPIKRSIPACAGEPMTAESLEYVFEVYPRVCGGTAEGLNCGGGLKVYPRVCGGTID